MVVMALLAVPLFACWAFVLVQRYEVKSIALRGLPDIFKQAELIAITYDTGFFRDLCAAVIFRLPDEVDGHRVIAQLPDVHPSPVPEGWLQNGLPLSFVCGEGIPIDVQRQYMEIMSSPGSWYQFNGTRTLIYTASMRMFAVLIYH